MRASLYRLEAPMTERPPSDEQGKPSERPPVPPSSPDLSTMTLLEMARSGDDDALEILCARYLPRLRRWATGRLPGHARGLLETEDVVQETLIRVVRGVERFESSREGALQLYLRQVLLNRITDEMRRPRLMGRLPDGSIEEVAPQPSPLDEVVGRDAVERYEEALSRLSSEEREAIVARIEFGGTYQELAEILGKPSADAARMAIGRALARLGKEMGREQ